LSVVAVAQRQTPLVVIEFAPIQADPAVKRRTKSFSAGLLMRTSDIWRLRHAALAALSVTGPGQNQ
jgi:hypothetical protein